MHTRTDVLRASAEWVWLPRGCDHETTDLQLVRYPARFGGGVRASRVESSSDAASVLDRAIELIRDGTLSGGMRPKVETCIDAINAGVHGVVILNGKTAHSVLLEIFTEHGAGTLIVP